MSLDPNAPIQTPNCGQSEVAAVVDLAFRAANVAQHARNAFNASVEVREFHAGPSSRLAHARARACLVASLDAAAAAYAAAAEVMHKAQL